MGKVLLEMEVVGRRGAFLVELEVIEVGVVGEDGSAMECRE